MKKFIILFLVICCSSWFFVGCKNNSEYDNFQYEQNINIQFVDQLSNRTISQYMSSSAPVYLGFKIKITNNTRDLSTIKYNNFYITMSQKKTGGDDVVNSYYAYNYYTSSQQPTINIESRTNKTISIWSDNAVYLNGTGKYSLPSLVSLYYAGEFIASYIIQI